MTLSEKNKKIVRSRRSFLKSSCYLACLFSLTKCKNGERRSRPHGQFKIAEIKDLDEGININLLNRLALIKNGRTLKAMSVLCTHQYCLVRPLAKSGESGYICPCHGSNFDAKGRVITGPATEDLSFYKIHLDEESGVVVDFDQTVGPDWSLDLPA